MNIAFFGTSAFIGSVQDARLLRRLIGGGLKPVVVVTTPDASHPERPHAIRAAAKEYRIPILQPATLKNFSGELEQFKLDLSIVAAYGKILPAEVLAVPKYGSLNIHPSLLPRLRGTTPIQSAILAGDARTGVTIIHMDELMDHGPIIQSSEFIIHNSKITAPELSDALTDLGVDLLLKTIHPWVEGRIAARAQDESQATFIKMLRKEDGHIAWSKSAREIERMVRAFKPWPGAYSFWQYQENQLRLLVIEADVDQITNSSGPAGIVSMHANGLLVETGAGDLIVRRLQLEGGKEMSAADFLRGRPDIVGSTLL